MPKKKPPLVLKLNTPEDSKLNNIVEMALGFSAMMRLFQEGSKQKLKLKIMNTLTDIYEAKTKEQFDDAHESFCNWGVENIRLTERREKGIIVKESGPASYGQIGKTFSVVLSVIIYYCHLPTRDEAMEISKWLHAAVDTKMMKHLKKLYPDHIKPWPSTIKEVKCEQYFAIQEAVNKLIQERHCGDVMPVQYEDIYWEALNKD